MHHLNKLILKLAETATHICSFVIYIAEEFEWDSWISWMVWTIWISLFWNVHLLWYITEEFEWDWEVEAYRLNMFLFNTHTYINDYVLCVYLSVMLLIQCCGTLFCFRCIDWVCWLCCSMIFWFVTDSWLLDAF